MTICILFTDQVHYLTARPQNKKSRWKRRVSSLLSKDGIQDNAQTLGKQIFTKLKADDRQYLISSLMHRTKGSPIKPTEQVHIGLWFTT